MTTFFVDTSAIAKRYLVEVDSTWLQSWIHPNAKHVIMISDLTPVEMFSLLSRRQRENQISQIDLLGIQATFLHHSTSEYLAVTLDVAVLTQARVFTTQYPLRALDAIQLAAAWRASTLLQTPLTFVSGDNKLLSAAAAEGFATDNPYLHP